MTKGTWMIAVSAAVLLIAAAPPLFTTATESQWTVTADGKPLATVTTLTDGKSVRAEWKPVARGGATLVFLGGQNKLWVRTTGGDVDFVTYKGADERLIVPALMLPFTTAAADKVDVKAGKINSYLFTGAKATYKYDASGPNAVDITAGAKKFTLTRSTIGKPAVSDASVYAVRPRKTAVTQISKLTGDIFGPSDTKVSATAGARGVGRGPAHSDGGDYAALTALEEKTDARKAKLEEALRDFQQEGNVGKGQGD